MFAKAVRPTEPRHGLRKKPTTGEGRFRWTEAKEFVLSAYPVTGSLHSCGRGPTASSPFFSGSKCGHIRIGDSPQTGQWLRPCLFQNRSGCNHLFQNRVMALGPRGFKSHGADAKGLASQRECAGAVLPTLPRNKQGGGSKSSTHSLKPSPEHLLLSPYCVLAKKPGRCHFVRGQSQGRSPAVVLMRSSPISLRGLTL